MKDKPDYLAHFVPQFSVDRERVASILSVDPGSHALDAAEHALINAAVFQYSNDVDGENSHLLSEVRSELKALGTALNSAEAALDSMSANDEMLLDQYYYVANSRDDLLLNLYIDKEGGPSAFVHVISRMRSAVAYFESKLDKPGKGKRPDYSHSEALGLIADFFQEHVPNRKLSPSGGVFYDLVVYWFNEVVGDDIVDPEHRIRNMLSKR